MSLKLKITILTLLVIQALLLSGCSEKAVSPAAESQTPAQAGDSVCPFRISELMSKNRAAYRAADGGFYDWIELENFSSQSASLSGWSVCINDEQEYCSLPDVTLEPGELFLINASRTAEIMPCTGFGLSFGDTVYLACGDGVQHSAVQCTSGESDVSVALGADGEYSLTYFCTPGYPNTDSGWEKFCSLHTDDSALVINEVMTSNTIYIKQSVNKFYDWVELKNVSDAPVSLSDYWLSDDEDNYLLWQLPKGTLDPGATILFYCSSEVGVTNVCTGFSLGSDHEQLFLSTTEKVADYVSLHDIPVDKSYGRVPGEKGFFYLEEPSPNRENGGGWRSFSARPKALSSDGIFNDASSVKVELSAAGDIRYTLDGSAPDADSALYDGAFTLKKTAVLRAIAFEAGKAPSTELVLSYFIGENCKLPVISLVADDFHRLNSLYQEMNKSITVSGNIAFYEDGGSFSLPCGMHLKGNASILWPKKNFAVKFSTSFGCDGLNYDLFGGDVSYFTSLNIRAGQDYPLAIIRNELMEKLARRVSDNLLVEDSRYCTLYINGNYWGIYSLKEDFSKQFYASHFDVSKDSALNLKCPVSTSSEAYKKIVQFCLDHDMTDAGSYAEFCKNVDIDSVVDWFIVEGYSGNSDVGVNMRFMGSPEGDGKWRFGVFDFDWILYDTQYAFNNIVYPVRVVQFSDGLKNLLKNEDFRARILTRYSEIIRNEFSNESVLALIDELQNEIDSEVPRDRERWYQGYESWIRNINKLRDYIIKNDYDEFTIDRLCSILHVTDEERLKYFGE